MLVVAALAASAAAHAGGQSRAPGPWCGGQPWRLMTLSDAQRKLVHFDRIETSVPAISKLQTPQIIGLRRNTTFQLHTWQVHATVDRYRIASNGDIVLVLFDIPSGMYMDAYLPNPNCLGKDSRDRTGIIAARDAFTANCKPPATAQWQLLGASIDISGVGYWDAVRTTRGELPNGAELRPVTNLSITAGCGVGG